MKRRTFLQMAGAAVTAIAGAAAPDNEEQPMNGMPQFPIVDTHVHFWDPKGLRYAWLDNVALLNKPYLPDDYRKAIAPVEVDRIVFLQAECLMDQALDEVEWVTSLAESEPRIQAIVATAPLEEGEAVLPLLEAMAENILVKGIRRMIPGKDADYCVDRGFRAGVAALGGIGLHCCLGIGRHQLASAAELAKSLPDVRFMVHHLGVPDIASGEMSPWAEDLARIAELPNVYCKMSGAATTANHESWTREDLRPYLEHVVECFGFERVCFGSDWPVMLRATAFPRWVETVAWTFRGYTETERRMLFRETAERFYRLGEKPTNDSGSLEQPQSVEDHQQ